MSDFIITKLSKEDSSHLTFTVENIDVSIINAIRRTLLTDIEVIVLDTSNEHCNIEKNTSRLTNEIIKQRLDCIPLRINDMDFPYDQYTLVSEKKNTSNHIEYVTTNDFKLVYNLNGKDIEKRELEKIFPKCEKTQMHIDVVRLRPKLSETLDGEELQFNCKLKKTSPRENSCYNVVSKVAFSNTIDLNKSKEAWNEYKKTIIDKEQLDAEEKNWNIFNSQRYFIDNSFDFVVESVGIYKPTDLMGLACKYLIKQVNQLEYNLKHDLLEIKENNEHFSQGYDIYLTENDITMGYLLQSILLKHYLNKIISYVGYNKAHPHDSFSILRIQLIGTDNTQISTMLLEAFQLLKDIFVHFSKQF